MRLPETFFLRTDVVQIAQDLLGQTLVTHLEGIRTSARITEVEAYQAPEDKASHAYNNRRTARTEIMFAPGGHAYVYLCYGIHHLFNVVTGPADTAHAILIRAVEPFEGEAIMWERRNWTNKPRTQRNRIALTTGPGALARAMGISTVFTGINMLEDNAPVWIETNHDAVSISAGKRIGIDYAKEWAEKPWRFWITDSPFVKK
jgi:DNA-3-methyladenine glycosylase